MVAANDLLSFSAMEGWEERGGRHVAVLQRAHRMAHGAYMEQFARL